MRDSLWGSLQVPVAEILGMRVSKKGESWAPWGGALSRFDEFF